ncbi:hypothetical protein JOC36_001448 [Weissella uvarum]|uniref:hypothetical protein n=1 Tax=Weissella uvarum TaxID=1479233 RepID=UPI001960CC7D|nr:hypothetical protein [Weissella uvarum]MBM7617855.1 hypothetical protein [Weissella uvarum]MCM0596147.1 hypothetical protein [Weissella uvarum]
MSVSENLRFINGVVLVGCILSVFIGYLFFHTDFYVSTAFLLLPAIRYACFPSQVDGSSEFAILVRDKLDTNFNVYSVFDSFLAFRVAKFFKVFLRTVLALVFGGYALFLLDIYNTLVNIYKRWIHKDIQPTFIEAKKINDDFKSTDGDVINQMMSLHHEIMDHNK